MLIDTHAHIDDRKFTADVDEVIRRAKSAGVEYIIDVGCDMKSSRRCVEFAKKYENVFATVGVHPHYAADISEEYLEILEEYFQEPKVLAVGEIGLDFYRDLSPRNVQAKVFKEQLELAKKLGKTVVIHDRDAHSEVLEILKDYEDVTKIMHCYAGGPGLLNEFLKIGCYMGFDGPLTYPNAPRLAEVVTKIPLERILVETDCPYLTPQLHRGERNEPAYVVHVAQKIADIRKISYEEVCSITTKNATEAFGLPSI